MAVPWRQESRKGFWCAVALTASFSRCASYGLPFTAVEIADEKKVLPIWHRVTKDFVLLKAPMLADKLALNTATKTIPEIASELKGLLE
ncbi:hypothetical protein [Corallococcus exercitus]|uniref:Uncharacterized protein n=1 Tax=Corallococcus exercitus TaxID=2316736 RepID=A0A7Y4JZ62_9BACT|nr:hypothetical protein [Corallococcus exercitus]NOK13725.1 hypothetical protein [Corallococcus exercitus]